MPREHEHNYVQQRQVEVAQLADPTPIFDKRDRFLMVGRVLVWHNKTNLWWWTMMW